jgi:hypothetical protein
LTTDKKVKSSKLASYIEAAKAFYVGPREAGHEIWVRFQNNLEVLLREAFLADTP